MAVTGEKNRIERAASPESVGISSQAIIDFLDCCEKEEIELHSFMLLRHGKVAAECWWKPFNAKTPHAMFSFSKSVTSAAIGFAIDEGLLALDTKVYEIFPEHTLLIKKKWQDVLTVEHLLTMTSGKMTTILLNTEKVGWVQSYLRAPFKSPPGEKFEYVTDNSFMLAAIIKKITGESMLDYLTPRLFEPLGIDRPFWETNQSGVETGGWGLYLKTEDQARFVQCLLNDGKRGGKQVIPEFWAKTVGENHMPETPGVSADHASGYGYHFWLNSIPNSYRCDGVFSQLGLVMKDQDISIVTTGGEPLEDKVLEVIWRYFTKDLSEKPLPENPEALERLRKKTSALKMPVLPKTKRREELEQKISGKLIKFRMPRTATVLGTVSNAISTKRSRGFNNVRLTFEKDCLKLFWTEKYDENTIDVGYKGKNIISKGHIAGMNYDFASSCAWLDDGSLEVWIRPLQQAQMRKLNFTFDGQKVKMKSTAEKGLYDLAQFGLDFKGIETDDLLLWLARGAASIVEPIVDPDLTGKFVEQIPE
jgi:CubicO group peptidase (beta-lactamase class C family)